MRILCLGGAGKICGEAVRDLAEFSDFERITVADHDGEAAGRLARELNDPRVDARRVDVRDEDAAVAVMREYDIVMDGLTIRLNGVSTALIGRAGCHGINLNGFGEEYPHGPVFKEKGRTHVPGFGMTPGVTDMMVRHAADRMESVEIVRVSHGAFRPIAFSPSITETTVYEYDPDLPGRVVFEDGEFIQVPPFSRERVIELPDPYGAHPQWIIPHAETRTAHEYLKHKGVRLIETRGTWPPANMRLVRALHDWGFLRNDRVTLGGVEFGIMDAVGAYLRQSPEGQTTELYGPARSGDRNPRGPQGRARAHPHASALGRLRAGMGKATGLHPVRGDPPGHRRAAHRGGKGPGHRGGHARVRLSSARGVPRTLAPGNRNP